MSQTIEDLERRYPWHCAILDAQQIAIPRITDLKQPIIGDMAIGEDGLIYVWTGERWY